MGSNLIIIVFAVVVVGGMGSILGAIVTGYMLGVLEGLTKVFYPEASSIVIFVIMAIVLLVGRRASSGGRSEYHGCRNTSVLAEQPQAARRPAMVAGRSHRRRGAAGRAVLLLSRPADERAVLRAVRLRVQPAHRLCRPALLRPCAFFGGAAYVTAHAVKVWGLEPLAGILLGVAGAAVLGPHRRASSPSAARASTSR